MSDIEIIDANPDEIPAIQDHYLPAYRINGYWYFGCVTTKKDEALNSFGYAKDAEKKLVLHFRLDA